MMNCDTSSWLSSINLLRRRRIVLMLLLLVVVRSPSPRKVEASSSSSPAARLADAVDAMSDFFELLRGELLRGVSRVAT